MHHPIRIGWITFLALTFALPCAGGQQAFNVQWPQNNINWEQLQNIFANNPAISQFNIQFPNMTNWSVAPSQLQALYGNYTRQASSLGFGSKTSMPNLSFSSLPGKAHLSGGNLSVPIQNTISGMELQTNNALEQMSQQLHSGSWMPMWLQSSVNHIHANAVATYNALPAWLRSGLETTYGYVSAGLGALYNKLANMFR